MAEPAFCTIEDLQGYEADILNLAPTSGHFNVELAAARREIEDRLIIGQVLDDLDKLGPTVFPRQLRLPSIFKTLEIIYRNNKRDEESPYAGKQQDYEKQFDSVFSAINRLDLDQDEDGIIQENEQNSQISFSRLIRRR